MTNTDGVHGFVCKSIIERVKEYSKFERIKRLIEFGVKGDVNLSPEEILEQALIQSIRHLNGEIENVLKMNTIESFIKKKGEEDGF